MRGQAWGAASPTILDVPLQLLLFLHPRRPRLSMLQEAEEYRGKASRWGWQGLENQQYCKRHVACVVVSLELHCRADDCSSCQVYQQAFFQCTPRQLLTIGPFCREFLSKLNDIGFCWKVAQQTRGSMLLELWLMDHHFNGHQGWAMHQRSDIVTSRDCSGQLACLALSSACCSRPALPWVASTCLHGATSCFNNQSSSSSCC